MDFDLGITLMRIEAKIDSLIEAREKAKEVK